MQRHRGLLRGWLTDRANAFSAPPQAVALEFRDGRVTYGPQVDGAAGLLALVGAEVLPATQAGTSARLKACANPACGAAFYDGSRTTSRVWHDVKTCGNVANLRASRARRRTGAQPPAG